MARILVADDEYLFATAYKDALTAEGHEVRCCGNGRIALAAIESFKPDLILTDFAMPDVDGSELARALRRDPRCAQIPIILVTAHLRDLAAEDVMLFDAVIERPISDRAVVASVAKALRDTKRRDGTVPTTAC